MKVRETAYLKKPALVLIPETPDEKDMLKSCLGSGSPLRVIGSIVKYDIDYLEGSVVLWDDSQNRSECLPEQDGPGPEIRVVRKKADIGDFMNALRRYINVTIDKRLYDDKGIEDEGGKFTNKIYEAAVDLSKTIKPLFEEEVH